MADAERSGGRMDLRDFEMGISETASWPREDGDVGREGKLLRVHVRVYYRRVVVVVVVVVLGEFGFGEMIGEDVRCTCETCQ